MNVIRYKYIFLTISWLAVFISIAAIAIWGLSLGIDFTGGSLLEVEYSGVRPEIAQVKKTLEGLGLDSVIAQPAGERGILMRFKTINEETHQRILSRLSANAVPGSGVKNAGPGLIERRFDTIGATIGSELAKRSVISLLLASAAIIAYIAWAFRKVSKPVSSWKYGVAAVLALIHDVTIPAGVFAVLGHFRGIEVDSLFITALLTIMGFSVHDTIVVFDRTRENLRTSKTPQPFDTIVNRSINETIMRSINTSFTVLLVLVMIYLFGGVTVQHFALALILGIAFGTYSSIFVASPLLVVWNNFSQRKKNKGKT